MTSIIINNNKGQTTMRTPNSTKRVVTFRESLVVRINIYDDEISKTERKSLLWYRPKEIELFRTHIKQTIDELKKCGGVESALDANMYCLRGLEQFIHHSSTTPGRSSRIHRQEVKLAFIKSILELQKEQRKSSNTSTSTSTSDPRRLQLLANACSRNAHKFARNIAIKDAEEVKVASLNLNLSSLLQVPTTATSRTISPITRKTSFNGNISKSSSSSSIDPCHLSMTQQMRTT